MQKTPQARSTKAKQFISHFLSSAQEPVALQELFRAVQKALPKTAYSTVFRVIVRLQEEGKIRAIDWRERGSRYEWADMPHHHHIVCQVCGAVADIGDADVNYDDAVIKKKTGYIIKHHSIELEGVCKKCRE